MEEIRIPEFKGGTYAGGAYNTGPVLADDSLGTTPEDGKMKIYTGTALEDILRYAGILEAEGFSNCCENAGFRCADGKISDPFYAVTGYKGNKQVYAYRTKATGEVRVIEETTAGENIQNVSFIEDTGNEKICQYALYYDPENGHSPTTTNCGMFYIVLLGDNSLFLIDGGDEMQCSKDALEGMYRFLRRLTGTEEGEKMRIAGWFFTHAHGDHLAACIRLLRTYPDAFELERVLFNYPSYQVVNRGYDSPAFLLKETIREFAPDAKAIKLHTGMSFRLAGTGFNVLYTHEDAVRPEEPDKYPFGDFNCTSTILKMTTRNGGTVMWLGDTNVETERLVAETIPAEVWKSDVVQIAHHCFNYLSKLYPR